MKSLGIYIHVPFCGRKCAYCDFYSLPYRKDTAGGYVQAVLRNIRHYSDRGYITDTVYFGGGTPSLLTAKEVSLILREIKENFLLADDAEITLEANPNTLSPDRLSGFFSAGINRLSVGVQSMNDSELHFLGRTHSAKRAEKAVLDAYAAGFRNISCDLMTALPGQTAESLRYSIERFAELPVTHISSYLLKVEEGTPFDCDDVKALLPDDDEAASLYLDTVRLLGEKGFMQYEISNFSLPGYESRHNCRYWKCLDYIGIGPSAHSCYKGKRFAVPRDAAAFVGSDVQPVTVTDESPCGFEEFAMLRLRLTEGLDLDLFPEQKSRIAKKIPALEKAGYVLFDGKNLSLTPEGMLVSNAVISSIIF